MAAVTDLIRDIHEERTAGASDIRTHLAARQGTAIHEAVCRHIEDPAYIGDTAAQAIAIAQWDILRQTALAGITDIQTEKGFAITVGGRKTIRGRIDLLYTDRDGEKYAAEIKTYIDTDCRRTEALDYVRAQLTLYRAATHRRIARILLIPGQAPTVEELTPIALRGRGIIDRL